MKLQTILVTVLLVFSFISEITHAQDEEDESVIPLTKDDEPAIEDEEMKKDEVLPIALPEKENDDEDTDEGSGDDDAKPLLDEEPQCEIVSNEAFCASKMLTSIPTTLPTSIVTLDLSDNKITELTDESFLQKYENLKHINLANNTITGISDNFFDNIPNVDRVNLTDNELSEFDPEVFAKATQLIELSLSGNPIKIEENGPLLHSSTLRVLKLQRCGFEKIPENIFDGVSSLEDLDLGENPIKEDSPLTVDTFVALTNLSGLVLPAGSGDELVMEVCKKHGLLPAICLDTCDRLLIPCGEADATTDGYYTDLTLYDDETSTVEGEVSETIKPPRKSGGKSRNKENMISPEDTVPESSRSGVTGAGVDQTIITIIIVVLIMVVATVVIKKNWSKIKTKWSGSDQQTNGPRMVITQPQEENGSPEEVPLRSKNPV